MFVIFTLNIFVLLNSTQTTPEKASKAKNEICFTAIAVEMMSMRLQCLVH